MSENYCNYKQVDVFTSESFFGNPVAVMLGAGQLTTEQMQQIAAWTNLSETTFILPSTKPEADYRLRIFTPGSELLFAGHPSIGSAHAAREAGMVPVEKPLLVQECKLGLVDIRVDSKVGEELIWVKAPPIKELPLAETDLKRVTEALRTNAIENTPKCLEVGPKWLVVQLRSVAEVQRFQPDMAKITDISKALAITGLTVFGYSEDSEFPVYLRSFAPAEGVDEDPVCGSGNMCVAKYLYRTGLVEQTGYIYTAEQGHELGRKGRVSVTISEQDGTIWVGGHCVTSINGEIRV